VTSKRKQAKEIHRWEATTRAWAIETARDLVLDLYYDRETTARPFRVGVVLDPGERVWAETPLTFSADTPVATNPTVGARPQVRPWLITNHRVVARLGDGRLHGLRWEHMVGCRVDLSPRWSTVAVDLDAQTPLVWTGPGVAPLAVAAVYHLHGPGATVEHPGLAVLRVPPAQNGKRTERVRRAVAGSNN
jgi:hypothetical protein